MCLAEIMESLVAPEASRHFCDGFGVDPVLFDLNPGVETLRSVARQHGNRCLGNDLACVHPCIDVMDSTSTFPGSCLQSLSPGVQAGILGKQGGMNIDDTAAEGIESGDASSASSATQSAPLIFGHSDQSGGHTAGGPVGPAGGVFTAFCRSPEAGDGGGGDGDVSRNCAPTASPTTATPHSR